MWSKVAISKLGTDIIINRVDDLFANVVNILKLVIARTAYFLGVHTAGYLQYNERDHTNLIRSPSSTEKGRNINKKVDELNCWVSGILEPYGV